MRDFTAGLYAAEKMRNQGQLLLAADRLEQLLFQPDYAVLPSQLLFAAYNLLGDCSGELGRDRKAATAYYQAAQYAVTSEQIQETYSNYLFFSHYCQDDWTALQAALQGYQHFFQGRKWFSHSRGRHQGEKIRLGYLSTDFYSHIVVNFSIQLFACYDRSRYEVFLYGRQTLEDRTTQQLQNLVDHWQNIGGMTYAEAATRIYEDGIDILVDLSGHTNRGATLIIDSYKPAPVQICGIGWFNTTGLAAMDYFMTDCYCCPVGQDDDDFTEQLIRLPHTHLCYTPPDYARQCRRDWQPHDRITFGSFNNFAKITDEMLILWLDILNQVPGSRLLLKNSHHGARHQQTELLARARRVGYQADQLELRLSTDGPLQEYQELDIALDTYPYPGGGTTCDALYYGVPVITLAGHHHGARFGASILQNVGLGSLVTDSPAAYVALASALAAEPQLLAKLHQVLPQKIEQSPLMDGRGYVQDIEAVYEKVWAVWMRQENPKKRRILIR